jgi:hypothetical protein
VPLVTATQWLLAVLDQLPLPGGQGTLQAFVTPPNPEEDELNAHAYIWPSSGSEARESMPRAGTPVTGNTTSGWKTLTHQIDIWVTWFDDTDNDQTPDLSFLTITDAVMDALRTTNDPVTRQDPVTLRYSQLYATGERMTYDVATVRGTTADQRLLRYDSRIAARVLEDMQA